MNRIALPIACHGFVLAFALSFAAPAVAQDEAMPLAEHRWSEQAYGLSLQPPAEARPVERPNSGGLVRFIVGETLNIRVDIENTLDQHEPETQNDRPEPESPFIRRNDSEVKLENVKSWALRQVAFANPNARLLEDELTEVVGRPAARIVFKVLPKDRPAWILAQVFMKIDPYTVVRFELQADADDQARALATFDAMLETIEVEDPRKLNERRAQWIEAGQAWFTSLDRSRLQ
ncbi:MAG: hypothetical protein ACODAQ_09715, partial [Phycisphaeraceae bacterium]